MKNIAAVISVFLLFSLILAACAKPPAEEMNAAENAVIRAENDADAVAYAGNTLIRARDALSRMRDEADAKRYDAAKNYAAEAISAAAKAVEDGKTGAARAREEAVSLLNSLGAPLAEAAASLDAAQGVPNINLDFDSLSDEIDLARSTYDDARQSFAADEYRDTVTKCQNVRSLLADVNGKITQAAQAASRKQ
jgi:hypothetical protein